MENDITTATYIGRCGQFDPGVKSREKNKSGKDRHFTASSHGRNTKHAKDFAQLTRERPAGGKSSGNQQQKDSGTATGDKTNPRGNDPHPGKESSPDGYKERSYTQAQADRAAAALYEAMLGGVTGLGTDSDEIWSALEGRKPEEIALIRKSFRDHYKKDLDTVIKGDLSGHALMRANSLLKGDKVGAAAAEIQDELDSFVNVSEEKILKTLEGLSPAQRSAVAKKLAQMNPGIRNGQPAEDFLLSRLKGSFNDKQMERARHLLNAGRAASPEMAQAHELKALKSGLQDDLSGLNVNEDSIYNRLEKATLGQRRALLADQGLMDQLQGKLSDKEFQRASGLLNGDDASATAARINQEMGGIFGPDKKAVRNILEGKGAKERALIEKAYQSQTDRSLQGDIRNWGDLEADVTLRLLNPPDKGDKQGQAQASADRIALAIKGAGTNEAALRQELEGKSKAEIDAIATAYEQRFGTDLRAELDAELDGRDQFEILEQAYDRGAIDPNDPHAVQKKIQRLRERQAFEQSLGVRALDQIQRQFKGASDNDRLTQNLNKAEQALQSGNLESARTLTGYAGDDMDSLQSSKDAVADGAATAAVFGATTVAVAASGGSLAPLAIAGYAAAGAASRAVTYGVMQGSAGGGEEFMRQGLIGLAEGATTVIPPLKGVGAGTNMVAKKAGDSFGKAAWNSFKTGAVEGAIGSATVSAVEASTQSETWENGTLNGVGQVMKTAASEGATGAVTEGFVKVAELAGEKLVGKMKGEGNLDNDDGFAMSLDGEDIPASDRPHTVVAKPEIEAGIEKSDRVNKSEVSAGEIDDSKTTTKLERPDKIKKKRTQADADRDKINDLVKAGKIDEAREVLRPFVDAAKNAKTPAEKRAAMDEIIDRLDVTSEKDKVFWSGDKENAGIYAMENGKTTLEQTHGGRVIDGWDEVNDLFSWDKSDMPPHGWDFWGEVSERYAKDAEGSIDIVQSEKKFPGGGPTWRNREWPIIRDGGRVDNMNIHKIDKAGSIVETMKLDPEDPATNSLFLGV